MFLGPYCQIAIAKPPPQPFKQPSPSTINTNFPSVKQPSPSIPQQAYNSVPQAKQSQLPTKVHDEYLPPVRYFSNSFCIINLIYHFKSLQCGNGGSGINCDTADGYNYDTPGHSFNY